MINSQNLINKITSTLSGGGLTPLQTCQSTLAINVLNSGNNVIKVASANSLPSAANNNGRMIYVDDENRYYYSAGGLWMNDFTSANSTIANLIYSWGRCSYNGTCFSSPVSIVGGFTDWTQISSNRNHQVALRNNGTLWAWGYNGCGRLGDGTTTTRTSPVSVVGGFTDWCQVSAGGGQGGAHTLAIRTNGTLWGWGYGARGQLGDNTITNKSSPVTVVGGFTDWCQAAAGDSHSLAIRTNGTLWSWGRNTCGTLGQGDIINRSSPVTVVGGFTDWCQVSAAKDGNEISAAIRTNGTIWTWGGNNDGQLGDGTSTLYRSSPVSVVGGFTDWCQVSAGRNGMAAIRLNGTLWSWGSQYAGRAGNNVNSFNRLSSPELVLGGFTDWCQVSVGLYHSIAIRTNGTIWSWGRNNIGQLGDGTTNNRSSPVSVVGGFTDWCQAAASACSGFALRKITKGF